MERFAFRTDHVEGRWPRNTPEPRQYEVPVAHGLRRTAPCYTYHRRSRGGNQLLWVQQGDRLRPAATSTPPVSRNSTQGADVRNVRPPQTPSSLFLNGKSINIRHVSNNRALNQQQRDSNAKTPIPPYYAMSQSMATFEGPQTSG